MKAKSLLNVPRKAPVRVVSLPKFVALPASVKASLAFPKEFKAGVVVDKEGSPRYFVFDSRSLWDLLCAVDTTLEAQVSDEAYVRHNPVGWLIDAIEAHLPLNPKVVAKLKKGLDEARRLGVVPFERIKQQLGLS